MPLYDLKCEICHDEIDDYLCKMSDPLPKCCGKTMTKKVNTGIASGFPEFGITLTNVAEQPVHFSCKSKMQAYARDHNLELGALL